MLRFQHISHLLALGLVPLIIVVFVAYIYWRKNKRKKLGDERLINEQMKGFIHGRFTLKFVLLTLAFTMLAIGWANLQMGAKTENVQRKGVDVVIALDVSKSMLAKDIQPDRLTRAKQLITRIVDKMQNDRVALVVFAGRAYLQVPLTIDYSAMKMMLQNVTPNLIPTQGTVISDAIDLSINSFSQKEKKYKSLVIISDGEDHDEKAVAKAKEASDAGIIIHTVGIGSPQGTTIVDPETKNVKLDEKGAPVVSKLNEQELKSIAVAGHGTYNQLQNTDRLANKLTDEMDGMEQKNLGAVVFTDYKSFFQYFLGIALVLLLLEWFLPSSHTRTKNKTKVKTA
ncbi:MAG: VWA domain-containing protein [Sphingobacteriales bacterium]|nr:MAG: VWA domain-containing protein [Sphingobacteriales bacterium]